MGDDAYTVLTLPTCVVGAWGMALGLGPVVLQFFDRLLLGGEWEGDERAGDLARRDDLARLGLCERSGRAERRDELALLPGRWSEATPSRVAAGLDPPAASAPGGSGRRPGPGRASFAAR